MTRDEHINKQLNYLKIAHPRSAQAIQSAQDFIAAMAEIQAHAGESQANIEQVRDGILKLAEEGAK